MQRLIRSIVTFKYQQNSGKLPENKENLLNRDFKASNIFQKLVTDITYIHVKLVGWAYLASVMDLYSRKILGYSYGQKIDAELATNAVKNACLNIKNTDGMILHSDLGSQYTAIFSKIIWVQKASNIRSAAKGILMITPALNLFIHY